MFGRGVMCTVVSNCDSVHCGPPGPSVHGTHRQECWSGLPCPPPGDLLNPGLTDASPVSPPLQVNSLPTEPLGKPNHRVVRVNRHILANIYLLHCIYEMLQLLGQEAPLLNSHDSMILRSTYINNFFYPFRL